MPKIRCNCGHEIVLTGDLVGRKLQCPACGVMGVIKQGGSLAPLDLKTVGKMLAKKKLKKALQRDGEPTFEASAFEPKNYERINGKIKFRCRCGKKIAVSVDATKTIGKCPHCKTRLVVPNFRK